jgi:hypothetical protein
LWVRVWKGRQAKPARLVLEVPAGCASPSSRSLGKRTSTTESTTARRQCVRANHCVNAPTSPVRTSPVAVALSYSVYGVLRVLTLSPRVRKLFGLGFRRRRMVPSAGEHRGVCVHAHPLRHAPPPVASIPAPSLYTPLPRIRWTHAKGGRWLLVTGCTCTVGASASGRLSEGSRARTEHGRDGSIQHGGRRASGQMLHQQVQRPCPARRLRCVVSNEVPLLQRWHFSWFFMFIRSNATFICPYFLDMGSQGSEALSGK